MSEGLPSVRRTGDCRPDFGRPSVLIDCDSCAMRDVACGDCVVTVLLGGDRVEVNDPERAALAVLADSGLVPRLRLVPLGPPGRRDRRSAVS